LRNIQYLKKNSVVVLNTTTVMPYTVYLGQSGYPPPDEIINGIRKLPACHHSGCQQDGGRAGSLQAANLVMLGALFGSGLMPIDQQCAKDAIAGRFNENGCHQLQGL
jgi:indolepyruvate ferredoxin oxidoreductase beta subunit